MATEKQFYEMLARIDHPVFPKDFTTETTADSPFNSIMNRLVAKQFVKLQAAFQSLQLNSFPQTADENTIDRWEETYGLSNSDLDLADRITALLIKRNQKITMSAPNVLSLALAITGQTPQLIRSIYKSEWILGQSILGKNTILAGGTMDSHSTIYVLIFSQSLSYSQMNLLDRTLTLIEKGGSSHSIISPQRRWILGRSSLGVDSVL